MKVRSAIIENFKGQQSIKVVFGDKLTEIKGENGSGKTTIMDAYFFTFTDCGADLTSNPNVRPDGADDGIVTRCEWHIEVGDKEITFTKIQKCKSKEGTDGKIKTTKVNSYEVNSVPKSQRDAFKYLEDLGFDCAKFLPLSHTDKFIKNVNDKKGRTDVRDVLFGMTSEISDKEVAEKSGLTEIAVLLGRYTKDEIVAMQNATKRKISQEYGKNGEVLDNKIDGLNSARADVDEDAALTEKTEIEKEIADIKSQISAMENGASQTDEILSKISRLQNQHFDYINGMMAKYNEKLYSAKEAVRTAENSVRSMNQNIVDADYEIKRMNGCIKEAQDQYKTVRARKFTAEKFDEASLVCPTCGRPFDENEANEIRMRFQKKVTADKKAFTEQKKSDVESIVTKGKQYQAQRDKAQDEKKEYEAKLAELKKTLDSAESELSAIKQNSPSGDDDFTKGIDRQIEELREKARNADNKAVRESLNAELAEAQERLRECDRTLAKAENNRDIDRKIADLQKKRTEYEQARLDCERILAEVNDLEMAKNELLTEQINSHFKLVKWVLFERQANGEILTDRCTPYIDGLSMIDSVNTGRVILGKLDICSSLQRFYGQSYPIWLDNAESLTSNTTDRIEVDGQLIMLSAVDGQQLTVNGGD